MDDRQEVNRVTREDAHQEVSQGTREDDRQEVNRVMQEDAHQEDSQGARVAVRQVASRRVTLEAGHRVVMAMQEAARRVAMVVAARKVAVADPRVAEKTAVEAEVTGHRISVANPHNGTGGEGAGAG
ncbi:hypothetical protein [Paraburkholderia sediminicola]|uniref:hypothetical protein n=1 Tax=Paraburkholderia sediminicola TaxID=458836 RepID=UPI0038BC47BC